jgi:opacity protein-like surface antigen
MKRSTIAILAAVMLLTTSAMVFAATGDIEVDGSFAFGTAPGSYDSGYGINAGAGYMLTTIAKDLQGRIDVGYYDFSTSGLSYTRVPVTVSARYYFPISDQLKVFAQAGVETSNDYKEYYTYFPFLFKQSKSEVNIGISPGAGVEFSINPQVSVFMLGRFHAITDSYVSMQFGGAFHF